MTSTEQIVVSLLEKQPRNRAEFDTARLKICSSLRVQQPPNRELLSAYLNLIKANKITPDLEFERLIKKAEIRSLSGIAVVTSLIKPYTCPGQCVYCPTEVRMPKSYIASEPAAARALALDFSPYEQMRQRILMLERNGHRTDKIEYIIKGGTWNAYTLGYQYWFILESFRACNEVRRKNPQAPRYSETSPLRELQAALEREQKRNETANHRIIGLTLETRPDAISPKTIMHMRRQGCTRIELGLQAPDDRILELVKRGHTVEQFREAMELLREAGFKVDLHFMPDLPGTTPEHDVEMYESLFSDPGLKPDMVKIYPNVVIKSAELYQWFLDGRYKPYGDTPAMSEALMKMKVATPRYCRISRLIRDIPATEISAGNTVTNLRELLSERLAKQGKRCVCLRCREIGRHPEILSKEVAPVLYVDTYETRGGTEYFITFEDEDRTVVFGFLRLRIPNGKNSGKLHALLPETKNAAFIRELHVYGRLVGIGKQDDKASQHKGLGKKLVAAAEQIAKDRGFSKVLVISGVGVRDYYRKIGYRKAGTYMGKLLSKYPQR